MKDFSPFNEEESWTEGPSINRSDGKEIHIERIVSLLPVRYYWGWTIFAVAYLLVSNVFIAYFEKSLTYFISSLILSILLAQQTIIIIWAKNKLNTIEKVLLEIVDLPQEEIRILWRGLKARIFDDKKMILMGLLMNVLAHVFHLDDLGYSYESAYSYIFIQYVYYGVHYFMGAGLYLLAATLSAIYSLSKIPLNINSLISRHVHFKGLLYSELTICAISVYLSWGIFYMTTPSRLTDKLSIIWFSSFAVILLLYFILSQYIIHRMMTKAKRDNLGTFSAILRSTAQEALKNPTKQNIICLRAIIDIQRQIDDMCQWPFGIYEILHIVLIVIIPLVVVILEIIFEVVR